MQEGVDHTGIELQIRRDRDVTLHRMGVAEGRNGRLDHLQGLLVLVQTHLAEHRLHPLHPGASVAGVQHDRRHTVRAQHLTEGLHPGLRVLHMVQHTGRHDEVELLIQARHLLDRK